MYNFKFKVGDLVKDKQYPDLGVSVIKARMVDVDNNQAFYMIGHTELALASPHGAMALEQFYELVKE